MESAKNFGDYNTYLPTNKPEVGASQNGDTPSPGSSKAESQPQRQEVPVRERIDSAINDTAGKLHNLAQKLDNYGESGSSVDQATSKVAETLKHGAKYLDATNVERLSHQIKETTRSNPLATIGIAFCVGFVTARLLKK